MEAAVAHRRSSMGGTSAAGYMPHTARVFTRQQLAAATQDFSTHLKIGEGGFGTVYRGRLDGLQVAVKVKATGPLAMQGAREFEAEVAVLSRLHHPHIILLLGSCPEHHMLVYELAEGGYLGDRLLRSVAGVTPLPWQQRFRIAHQTAAALLYMHSTPERIVHMDLNPRNIVLTRHDDAKLGDVGLARLMSDGKPVALAMSTTQSVQDPALVGCFAYIDPEYARTGRFSPQSDLYALGVIMLQLLTGQEALRVVSCVEDAADEGRLNTVLDPAAGAWPNEASTAFAGLALRCAAMQRRDRPDLRTEVLPVLDALIAAMPAVPQSAPPAAGPSVEAPSAFRCPITHDIMTDPVILGDGHTYERAAIARWLQQHDTCPQTNSPLSDTRLTPNRALQCAILQWQQSGSTAMPAAGPSTPAAAAEAPRPDVTAPPQEKRGTPAPLPPGAAGSGVTLTPADTLHTDHVIPGVDMGFIVQAAATVVRNTRPAPGPSGGSRPAHALPVVVANRALHDSREVHALIQVIYGALRNERLRALPAWDARSPEDGSRLVSLELRVRTGHVSSHVDRGLFNLVSGSGPALSQLRVGTPGAAVGVQLPEPCDDGATLLIAGLTWTLLGGAGAALPPPHAADLAPGQALEVWAVCVRGRSPVSWGGVQLPLDQALVQAFQLPPAAPTPSQARTVPKREAGVVLEQASAQPIQKHPRRTVRGSRATTTATTSTRQQACHPPSPVTLYIKDQGIMTWTITGLTLQSLVRDVKAAIQQQTGIPSDQQHLLFFGELLTMDWRSLDEYNVENGSTLHMLQRLRGD